MAESAVVYPRQLSLDSSNGGGDGGVIVDGGSKSAIKRKDEREVWSWQWGETMVLSAPLSNPSAEALCSASLAEVARAGDDSAAHPQERHNTRIDGESERGCLADSLASDAVDNERLRAVLDETNLIIAGAPSACGTDSSRTVAASGSVATDNVQQGGDDSSSSDTGTRALNDKGSLVLEATVRQGEALVTNDGAEKQMAHRSSRDETNISNGSPPGPLLKPGPTPVEMGEVRANNPAPGIAGATKRRGVSFWSPTRSRRNVNTVPKPSALEAQSSDVGSSSRAIEAGPTTSDFTAGTVDGKPGDRRPSNGSRGKEGPDISEGTLPLIKKGSKNGGSGEQGRADDGSTGDSSKPLESLPGASIKMEGMDVAVTEMLVDKVKDDAAERSANAMRKGRLSFWSKINNRRNTIAKTGAAGSASKSGTVENSNCDEPATVSGANIVNVTPADKISRDDQSSTSSVVSESVIKGTAALDELEGRVDGNDGHEMSMGDSVNGPGGNGVDAAGTKQSKTSPGSLLKRSGASFWSPKRTRGSDVDIVRINPCEDGRASDAHDAAAATPSRLLPDASTKKQAPREKRGVNTGPTPSKGPIASDSTDVLLLEVWEVKDPNAPSPRAAQLLDVAGAENSGSDVQSSPAYLKDANSCGSLPLVAEVSDQSDSGDEPLSARSSTDKCPGDETAGALMPPIKNYLRTPETVCGLGMDDKGNDYSEVKLSNVQQVCADDGHVAVARDEVGSVDDDASILLGASAKTTLRQESSSCPLHVEGDGSKTEATSLLSECNASLRLSETDRKGSSCVDEGQVNDAGVHKKSGSDNNDGDDDDDASVVSQGSFENDLSMVGEASAKNARNGRRRRRGIFSSPFASPLKGGRTNRKRPPQQHPAPCELPSSDQQHSVPDRKRVPRAEGVSNPRSIDSLSPRTLNSVLWGRLTIPMADIPSTGRGESSSINDEQHGVGGFGLDCGDHLTSTANSDCSSVLSPSSARGGGPSSVLWMHLPWRDPERHARDQTGIRDRVDSSTGIFENSVDDSCWLDVRKPRGKLGNRVKGRVRLTWVGGC